MGCGWPCVTCWMFEGRSESGMRRCGAARVREDFRIAPFFGMVAAAERRRAEQRVLAGSLSS